MKQFITGSRLRSKFLLLFVVFASTPLLILGGVGLYLIDLSHRHDVSNLELQALEQKKEEIEKFLADTLGILELRVDFRDKAPIDLPSEEFILAGILKENPAFEEVSFIGLGLGSFDAFEGRETLKRARQADEVELLDLRNMPRFRVPLEGKNYISDVRHTLSGPIVTLAAPVRNRNGEIIQVLSAEVNLSGLVRSVELERIGSSGYLVLVDKNGTLIASGVRGKFGRGADLSGFERVGRTLGGGFLTGLEEHDRYLSPLAEVPVVGAGRTVPATSWGVLVEWPLEDADALLETIRSQILSLVLASIFGVMCFAPIFARRVVEPVRELKRGAEAIEEGNFEKRVRIKTRDELEELGAAFNKMAQGLKRLQELKNEFVFVAAHELRGPVTVIKGYTQMLTEDVGKLSKSAQEFISQIQIANQNLVKLVDDLLQVARSEAGRIEIQTKPVDIREVAKGVVEGLKPTAAEKGLELRYEEPAGLPKVLADPDKLKEILMNLATNAIKYTLKGSVTVSHELKDKTLVTHVKDTGVGLSPEDQKKLFEKFFRAKRQETIEVSGTGLGLWIVRELLHRMKGDIRFQSELNKGSTFSFSLPVV